MQTSLINQLFFTDLLLALLTLIAIGILIPDCFDLVADCLESVDRKILNFNHQTAQFHANV